MEGYKKKRRQIANHSHRHVHRISGRFYTFCIYHNVSFDEQFPTFRDARRYCSTMSEKKQQKIKIINSDFYAGKYEYLKLRGLTIGENSLSVVQGNEELIKSQKACDEEYFHSIVDTVKQKIDEASKCIHNSDFDIAPIKKDDCKKCEFYDTCFVNLIPQLNKEEEEKEEEQYELYKRSRKSL